MGRSIRHQDLSGCHCLYIYCKDTTVHDFSGTVLYCKEESLPGLLKILFVRWLHIAVVAKDFTGIWISSHFSGAVYFFASQFGRRQAQKHKDICHTRIVRVSLCNEITKSSSKFIYDRLFWFLFTNRKLETILGLVSLDPPTPFLYCTFCLGSTGQNAFNCQSDFGLPCDQASSWI